jgi:hypothetical protein
VTLPPAGKPVGLVVYIQDVHANLGAQKNIAQAVAALGARDDVGFFALEGTHRSLDLGRFRAFPGRESVRLVADFLLRENKISGPIHAAFTGPEKMPAFIGVEDPALYQANVDAFKTSAPRLAETEAAVSMAQSALNQRKSDVFRTELKNLDRAVEAYRQGGKFGVYLKAITQAAPDKAGPTVKGFLRVLEMESRFDFSQVENERTRLLERLTAVLTPDQTQSLVASSVEFRTGRITSGDFYRQLSRLCSKTGVPLSAFPAMDGYIRYVLAAEEISAEDLFEAVAQLEKEAYHRVAKTPEERSLVLGDRRLFLTAKLVDFSLTPGEWAEYRVSKADESTTIPALENLSSFENFYRQADARDAAMTTNFISLFRSHRRAQALQSPVLITGGYHAGGITQRLTNAGFAVASFVPRIEKLDGPQGAATLSIFSQEKTPLEKLFEGETLFLAPDPLNESVSGFEAPAEIAASEARLGYSARDVMIRLAPAPVLNKITRIVQTIKDREATITFWFARGGRSIIRTLSSESRGIRFFWEARKSGLIPLNLVREQLFVLPALCLAVATFLLFGMHSPWAIPAACVAGIAGLLAERNPFLAHHPALKAAEFGVSPESYKTVVESGYWFFGLATLSATLYSLSGLGGVDLAPLATLLIRDGILTGIGAHFFFNLVSPIPAMGFWPAPKGSVETFSVSIGKFRHLILRDSRAKTAAHLQVLSEMKENQDLILQLPAGQAALFLPAHSETPWAWNTLASEPARVDAGYRGVEMTLQAGGQHKITIDLPKLLLLNVVSLRMQLFYGRSIREEEKRFLSYLKGLSPGPKKALQELMPSPLEEIIEPRIYLDRDRSGVIRGVEILKTTYDGRKHYRVFIELLNAEQATLTANGELQAEGDRPIEIRLRMDSDVDPLTPIPFEKIFTLKARPQ